MNLRRETVWMEGEGNRHGGEGGKDRKGEGGGKACEELAHERERGIRRERGACVGRDACREETKVEWKRVEVKAS